MAQYKGQLTVCDRCGCKAFAKYIGKGEADGGYTTWDKFESLDGWVYEVGIGYLCPSCKEDWDRAKQKFIDYPIDRRNELHVEL